MNEDRKYLVLFHNPWRSPEIPGSAQLKRGHELGSNVFNFISDLASLDRWKCTNFNGKHEKAGHELGSTV